MMFMPSPLMPMAIYMWGGNFDHVHATGGANVADTAYIAKWTVATGTWSSIATGFNAVVRALAIGLDGTLYVGGNFTNFTDANGDYITMRVGANWHSLGTGMSGTVKVLEIGPDGNLYAGGDFALAGGVANTAYIAKWNGVTWGPLGTGMGNSVNAIKAGPDGSLYVGGDFITAGGIAATYIARWNGIMWSTLGSGVNFPVLSLLFINDILYAGGEFTRAGGISVPDSCALWNGTVWGMVDVSQTTTPGSITYYSLGLDKAGTFYIGFSSIGSAISATVVIPNIGSATAYPIITFVGPGTIYQLKNYTTGRVIYFNLTLLAGETAILNLNPTNISFQSTFRGNILNAILPGSNLDFPLLPGTNNISTYIFGSTTAATAITMTWREQYWSLDGAAWK